MAKKADRYFEVNPWKIVETHFDPAYAKVAWNPFSLWEMNIWESVDILMKVVQQSH